MCRPVHDHYIKPPTESPPRLGTVKCFTSHHDSSAPLYRCREVTPGVEALKKNHTNTCSIRSDLKSSDLAALAGDLYKSNVLFMTHLGSAVIFIFSKKKREREKEHFSLIYSLADSLWRWSYNKWKNAMLSMLKHTE